MEQGKDLILVHTVHLKPMINAHSLGRMVSSGISVAVITSVHSEKTRLKKMMIKLIYYYYYYYKSRPTYQVEKINEVGVCQRLEGQEREFTVRSSSCEV